MFSTYPHSAFLLQRMCLPWILFCCLPLHPTHIIKLLKRHFVLKQWEERWRRSESRDWDAFDIFLNLNFSVVLDVICSVTYTWYWCQLRHLFHVASGQGYHTWSLKAFFCALWKVVVFRTREAELFLVGECEILVLGLPDSSMICMWVGRSHGS